MYKACPRKLKETDEEQTLVLAMLSAIASELNRRKIVKEAAKDAVTWMKKLDTKALYEKGAVMVRIDAKTLYETCADYLRFAYQEGDQKTLHCACLLCSKTQFPDDVFIARGEDGPMYRKDFAPMLMGKYADGLAEESLKTVTAAKTEKLAKDLLKLAEAMGRDDVAFACIARCVSCMTGKGAGMDAIAAFGRT